MPRRTILLLLLALLFLSGCTDGAAEEQDPDGKNGEAMTEGGHKHVNRLAKEMSPYLLQHAHNPVDWFPWGDEAFKKAKEEDKPVFLSIGYATCHWCHVMERESFENEEIAEYLNEHFVPVKVDREERPDVDNIYMAAVQAMTGSGGWPLSVFLTPEGKPFWGGTYFPPEDRYGRPGFSSILEAISKAWNERRPSLLESSEKITEHIRTLSATGEDVEIGAATLKEGVELYAGRFDAQYGGFEQAPKFPRCHSLSFLLRQYDRSGEARTLEMVTKTLDFMARGGVYDHLGGGFHRYSTDRTWLVPHFEKMLYDQAIAARAYLEAWQITGDDRLADVARDVFRYVLRDMTDAGGGFYSAEDADSEGVEGKFYVWSRSEVEALLGAEDAEVFSKVYGVYVDGNFREEATGEETGLNILHLPKSLDAVAKELDVEPAALEARLAPMRGKLWEVREKRIHPLKDDKILTDWNGLMISTFAFAGRVLGEPKYTDAAERAADFILGTLAKDGRLLHRYRNGKASIPAFLDDYAFLALGLTDLYEATFDDRWLREAKRITAEMIELFGEEDEGGFLFSGTDNETLVSRTKELYDGAIPSGNSVATLVLLRLARMTMEPALEKQAARSLEAFSGQIAKFPMGFPVMLMALDFATGPTREIVLAGEPGSDGVEAMARAVHRRFLPRAVLLFHPDGAAGEGIRKLVPFVAEQKPVDGKATAYVCEDYACREPVTTVEALTGLLDE